MDLALQVRRLETLQRAWDFVEHRARSSKDKETQAALADFRRNTASKLKSLQTSLQQGTFEFQAQRGVLLKRSGGKTPRPIVVAPVVNRIVQRAILNTCQSTKPVIRKALGGLPAVIDQRTSFGGLPGRGVPEAMELISTAFASAAKYYVRSDLKDFFTKIPKAAIRKYLAQNINQTGFVDLFMLALDSELSNPDEVRDLIRLFPLGDIGVPQGSALSALCANIALQDFDQELNGRGVTTIRYLDDFLILAPTKRSAEKAWQRARTLLADLGLEPHDPDLRTGKAARGLVEEGLEFLSFRADGIDIGPTRKAKAEFIQDIRGVIRTAKREIAENGAVARRAEKRYIQSLELVDRKVRGWGDAFRASTKRLEFSQMDARIDRLIDDYSRWFQAHIDSVDPKVKRRKMGIALLADTPRARTAD